jgi:cystathionine gamma-synthase
MFVAVKEVYYPKYSPTKQFYDNFRNPNGGYGGLFSVTFRSTAAAVAFFDVLEVFKGPSLGTNFTLRYSNAPQTDKGLDYSQICSCPYTILAHYNELDWVSARESGDWHNITRKSSNLFLPRLALLAWTRIW